MSDRKMFADMDADTRHFYSKIVKTAMLNIYAVDHHLFDSLLCESNDPMIMFKWQKVEPLIINVIQNSNDIGFDADQ